MNKQTIAAKKREGYRDGKANSGYTIHTHAALDAAYREGYIKGQQERAQSDDAKMGSKS